MVTEFINANLDISGDDSALRKNYNTQESLDLKPQRNSSDFGFVQNNFNTQQKPLEQENEENKRSKDKRNIFKRGKNPQKLDTHGKQKQAVGFNSLYLIARR